MGDKKKKRKSKNKAGSSQSLALRYVQDWVFRGSAPSLSITAADEFLPPETHKLADPVIFEFHSHSKYSDGFLSPAALVERAHRNGVRVLAITDHDNMGGIPEAVEAAVKFGMKIIPGVEISASYSPRGAPGIGELVHILAYYGTCGPAMNEELEALLSNIRDGRYLRAKKMLLNLKKLKMPIKWEHVAKIAGDGVAPGRLHVARAMVEAGHVENLRQAFSKYLCDGGPAYAMGSEPSAEAVVQLISRTGGVSALAHPWALKDPVSVIRALKAAGLHALEVYRSDGKAAGFSELADTYGLLKIGGSDFHGRGERNESDLGSVGLPIVAIYKFLKIARPIWFNVMKDVLLSFAIEPSDANLEKIMKFGKPKNLENHSLMSCSRKVIDLYFSSLLANGEEDSELENIRLRLAQTLDSR
ncbi:uncharacterized protein [Typha angustifolia]|uniref:uncharacterized protein n=1 Tax=Typha angustifolia TaxID=59011 RepID=UPI003C30A097